MTAQSLFPEAEQQSKQDRAAELDQRITDLCYGKPGGPFEMTLGHDERAVLRAIRYHRGAANAITIRELRSRIKLTERQIKQIVRTLRISYHLPIGSSKNSVEGGYFLMLTIEDEKIFDASFLDQVRAQIQAHRCATSPSRTRELLGQLLLEVQE